MIYFQGLRIKLSPLRVTRTHTSADYILTNHIPTSIVMIVLVYLHIWILENGLNWWSIPSSRGSTGCYGEELHGVVLYHDE